MRSLQDYDISPQTGFLPPEPPLRRLSNPYFEPWESTMDDFNGLLLAGRLREKVRKLPILDHKHLTSKPEYRRAFLVLCMLSHGYVWGKHEEVSESLPPCLAIPWTQIASYLGVCPVVCHASVVLWNYKPLWEDGPLDLSNLAALTTYSGSVDEAWFYLVTVAVESAGAPALSTIMSALDHVQANDEKALIDDLTHIKNCLINMNVALARMSEKCDPYVFYWKIRPYLAGWENMADAGLPLGLIYEGVDNIWDAESDEYADISHLSEAERMLRQYRKYAGGSAAQSSLIHALDVAFGIEHYPTGERKARRPSNAQRLDRYNNMPPTNPVEELASKRRSDTTTSMERSPSPEDMKPNRNNFIQTMRKYMPREHRHFLSDLEKAANLRPYMLNLQNLEQLTTQQTEVLEAYNACLDQLKVFRDKHVQIVSLYIVNQARKGPNIPHGGFAIDHARTTSVNNKFTPTSNNEKKAQDADSNSDADESPSKPNILYPQTALSTSPSLSKSSSLYKLNNLLPTLGLAKYVDPESKVVRGTGGTNVMPFLKQSRDETADSKIALYPVDTEVEVQAPLTEVSVKNKTTWTDWLRK
ncbi:Indoleamine 2,3-dioxygenase [Umbelopsis sp. PMI_123]|nr:Indoleamine 2,3-dioxygenase [Umbelopsis sp. PMI_123]